jgi:hypothetical protein
VDGLPWHHAAGSASGSIGAPDMASVTPVTVPTKPVMYPSAAPRKQGNDMTNGTDQWNTNRLDVVVQFLIGPIALAWVVLFAVLAGLTNSASAKPTPLRFHFTINQVEASCSNGRGTFVASTGRSGYGCTGAGGTLSCTAKGNCTFTAKLHGVKIRENATIEDLIRSLT